VQIVDDPAMAARSPLGLAIVGNVRLATETLLTGPPPGPRPAPPRRTPVPPPPADRLTDALLMTRLDALRPRGMAIVEEAPSTRGPLHDYFPIRADEEFHTCASGGLGHGLPAAVGVALAQPGRTVLALLGDGSSMYTIQSLWTAANLGLDIRFLIVNNGGYAALEQFGRLFGIEAVGSKIGDLDFRALAKGHGLHAVARIDDPIALDAALTELFAGAGPKLLEVMVEPTED
jgi:benzoylformate decarboxylase